MNITENAVQDLTLRCYQNESCNNAEIYCLSRGDDICTIDCLYGNNNCDMVISMNHTNIYKFNDQLINIDRDPSNMCTDCNGIEFRCNSSSGLKDAFTLCDSTLTEEEANNVNCCPWPIAVSEPTLSPSQSTSLDQTVLIVIIAISCMVIIISCLAIFI